MMACCNPIALQAQSNPTEKRVADLFKNAKKIQWYKYYKGRVDDINDVGLVIAYDGKECKGYITYLRSREQFKLEGHLTGDKIKLRETDTEESVTGHFEGKFFGDYDKLKAHWYNREKTRAGLLMLTQIEKEVIFPSYCGDNKWVRKYEGTVGKQKVVFIIQRKSDLDIGGVICFKDKKTTHCLKGGMVSEDKLKVVAMDNLGNKLGAIEGGIEGADHDFRGNWINPKGEETPVSFTKIDHLMVGCVEYQDYMSTYDVTFPKSKNSSFNKFIDERVGAWKASCKRHTKNLKERKQNPGPEDRAIANAAGWFSIEHVSDKLISGYLTFNKSWEEEHEDYSFNYDLVNDKKITLEDIFREGVEYHKILEEKAMKSIRFKDIYVNPNFKEWISSASFDYFTIRDNGIRYSTVFHPIYGRQSITVAFDDIEEYLDTESPIAYLYREVKLAEKKKKKKKTQN